MKIVLNLQKTKRITIWESCLVVDSFSNWNHGLWNEFPLESYAREKTTLQLKKKWFIKCGFNTNQIKLAGSTTLKSPIQCRKTKKIKGQDYGINISKGVISYCVW